MVIGDSGTLWVFGRGDAGAERMHREPGDAVVKAFGGS